MLFSLTVQAGNRTQSCWLCYNKPEPDNQYTGGNMQQITQNTVVTLDYHVTDNDGTLIDEGREPLVYLHGGYDDVFPRIEEALEGKGVGDQVVVTMQPGEAFGEYDADLVRIEPLNRLSTRVEVGMQVMLADEPGEQLFTVTDIVDNTVVLDGNHPLAGVVLLFTCTVLDVRLASAREISAGGGMPLRALAGARAVC